MKAVLYMALGLAACLALAGSPVMAQQQSSDDASTAWGSTYAPPDANTRAVNLGIAEGVYGAQHGGLATYNYTTNTSIGTENVKQTYNGPVTSTSSTNAVNANSVSAYLAGAQNSMATVTVKQGSSGGVDQGATATTQSGTTNTSGH